MIEELTTLDICGLLTIQYPTPPCLTGVNLSGPNHQDTYFLQLDNSPVFGTQSNSPGKSEELKSQATYRAGQA